MKFRQKLFLGSVGVVAALATVASVVALLSGRARLERAIAADFARAPEVLRSQLAGRFLRFSVEVTSWAEDKRYASWLGRASGADQPGGEVAAADLKAAHDGLGALALSTWGEFLVLNDVGRLLLDADRQDVVGEDLSKDPAVARALEGGRVVRLRGKLIELLQAVEVEGNVRGVLVAGLPLDPVAADVAAILRARVTFDAVGRAAVAVHQVERGDETWLVASVPVPGLGEGEVIGTALLERSLSAELRPLVDDLVRAIALAAAAGLLAALLLAIGLARSLAAPVAALAEATREVGRGHYDHRVVVSSKDELGQLGAAFNQMAAGLKQRVFFESALRRYLAAPVVEQLIKEPERLQLGGEKREVTVLFFDVAGFTSLAEALPPDQLVALVNAYLDELVEAIFRHGGTFDKFIGDAVMAFWGAPMDDPEHAARACRAGLEMHAALARFCAGHPSPRVKALHGRVGLNSGPAVLGNLGSTQVMNYTAMGDTVNVASRLEGVNKLYGTATLASEATVRAAGSAVAAREIDRVRVVGRAAPLTIYELSEAPSPAWAPYAEGLAAYRERRFADAQAAFARARAAGDGRPAEVMEARAEQALVEPPPADWDGAYLLLGK